MRAATAAAAVHGRARKWQYGVRPSGGGCPAAKSPSIGGTARGGSSLL